LNIIYLYIYIMEAAEKAAWKEISKLQENVVENIANYYPWSNRSGKWVRKNKAGRRELVQKEWPKLKGLTTSPDGPRYDYSSYEAFSELLGKRVDNTKEIKDPDHKKSAGNGKNFHLGGDCTKCYRTKARLYIERYMKKYTREEFLKVVGEDFFIGDCDFTRASHNTVIVKLKSGGLKASGAVTKVEKGVRVNEDITVKSQSREGGEEVDVLIPKGAVLRVIVAGSDEDEGLMLFEFEDMGENYKRFFGESGEVYCSAADPNARWLSIPYGITHGLLQTDGSPYKVNDDGNGTTEVNDDGIATTEVNDDGIATTEVNDDAKGGRRRRKKTVKRRKTKRTKKRKTKRRKKKKRKSNRRK